MTSPATTAQERQAQLDRDRQAHAGRHLYNFQTEPETQQVRPWQSTDVMRDLAWCSWDAIIVVCVDVDARLRRRP